MKLVGLLFAVCALAIVAYASSPPLAMARATNGAARSAAPESFTIIPSAGDHGWIDPQAEQVVPAGSDFSFTMHADPGYVIDSVVVDGVPVGAVASYKFTNVMADHEISVTFAVDSPGPFALTPEPGAHGVIAPPFPQTVAAGESFTFQIMPDAGYVVSDVLVDGVSAGPRASYEFLGVHSSHTLAATFALATEGAFVLTPSTGGHGVITPDTPQAVLPGGAYTFFILPDSGYHVEDVLVDGMSVGPRTLYTFLDVRADHTLRADFAIDQAVSYVLTPSAGAHGLITPLDPQVVSAGTSFRFLIVADAGYHVADVVVDGASVGPRDSYDFVDVQSDHTLAAEFAADAGPVITVTAPEDGQTWMKGSSQLIRWTLASAVASGHFRVTAISSGGHETELTSATALVAATPGSTAYAWSYAVNIPPNDVYDIRVSYESDAGQVLSESTAHDAVRVLPVTRISVTAPGATTTWRRHSNKTVRWSLTEGVSAGEFHVWSVTAKGKRYRITGAQKPVPTLAGSTGYTASWKIGVPSGKGYRVVVEYWWAGTKLASAKSASLTIKK